LRGGYARLWWQDEVKREKAVGCTAAICVKNVNETHTAAQITEEFVGRALHELTHCKQAATGAWDKDKRTCKGCMCNEVQANAVQYPDRKTWEWRREAKASCTMRSVGSGTGFCSEDSYNEAASTMTDAWTKQCGEKGMSE
jgi:hypothetical protein